MTRFALRACAASLSPPFGRSSGRLFPVARLCRLIAVYGMIGWSVRQISVMKRHRRREILPSAGGQKTQIFQWKNHANAMRAQCGRNAIQNQIPERKKEWCLTTPVRLVKNQWICSQSSQATPSPSRQSQPRWTTTDLQNSGRPTQSALARTAARTPRFGLPERSNPGLTPER